MSIQIAPTKGNLINTKKSLALAKTGFDLLDKKRNIIIREMMTLIDRANIIQDKIDNAYTEAYLALQRANLSLGFCDEISKSIPFENSLKLNYKSIMGVEIPLLKIDSTLNPPLTYGLMSTNSTLDDAYIKFNEVKILTVELAEVENSVYKLADAVKKTQKRANALKNIIIPRFEYTVKFITEVLEEKDREEFSRLKVIKGQKHKK